MEIHIEQIEKENFKPFTVTIKIEDVNEARELWYRLLTNYKNIIENCSNKSCTFPSFAHPGTTELFYVLDSYMSKNNLK